MPVVIKSRERVGNAFVEKLFVEWNDVICLLFGSLCIIGAIRDWNWLCDPTGKPHAPLLTRGLLRAVFLMLGTILVVCSVWLLVKRLQ